MKQASGFVAQREIGKVCRLQKSLFGLKQSFRAWLGKFSQTVETFGCRRVSLTILFSIGILVLVSFCW